MRRRRATLVAVLLAAGLAACLDDSPNTALPDGVVPIATIQGDGPSSAFVDRRVTIRGVVSGDFQDGDGDNNNLGGFFVQSLPADRHSAGLFVFDGPKPRTDVSAGDIVLVDGKVQEHFGETQLVADAVAIDGHAQPIAVDIEFPVANWTLNEDDDPVPDLERYEGQLVRIAGPLVVTDVYELERYGAIRLAYQDRLYQFTNGNAPDRSGYETHQRRNAVRTIRLDDGRRESNAVPIRFLEGGSGPGGALRVGDTVGKLVGNLRYSRGSGPNGAPDWRLMPAGEPAFVATNPRPGAPDAGGSTRVASFNVLNYFSTIDRGNPVCGPDNDGCRGADSELERRRQLEKIVSALGLIDADIIGLIELENNASQSLDDIVDAMNDRFGFGNSRYAAIDTGTIGTGPIKTGFVYDATSVMPSGAFALLDRSVDARFDDNRSRPALAQTFETRDNGKRLTVIINHLKSKGSPCDEDGDPNQGDGQGNCNGVRTAAAAALADWAMADPTGSGDPDVLVLGDLNAYLAEDPLRALKAAGFVNLLELKDGQPPYSFVYDGQSGALDHALASPSLVPQVISTIEWHINADEASLHDYNLEHGRDPALFDSASPYRSADHDPVVIGIELN